MEEWSWQAAYRHELQGLWSLFLAPLAFLAWRAAVPMDPARARVPEAARFVSGLTLFFAIATMIDPICTGPIASREGIAGTFAATAILFFFVLLGDLRVLLLAIGVARPERSFGANLGWAAGTTLIVPVATGVVFGALDALVEDLHGQWLWMIYEAGFFALCVGLSRGWVPRSLGSHTLGREKQRFLRTVFGYSAAYYALWLMADVLIVIGELDLGWAVRMVPNQLYYAFWVPFVYGRFFSGGVDPDRAAPNASR